MNKFIALTVSDFNQKTTVLVNLDTVKTIRPDFKTNGSILTFVDGHALPVVESIEFFQKDKPVKKE